MVVQQYTPTQVVLQFGSCYNTHGWTLLAGDSYIVSVAGVTAAATVAYPTISSVSLSGVSSAPTVTINGTGFGQVPDTSPGPASCYLGTGTGYDYAFNGLSVTDSTDGWFAGQPTDCVGLVVKEYTSTQVVLQFGSYYNTNGWVLHAGDSYIVSVAGAATTDNVAYPTISSVSFSGSKSAPTVTIYGTGFGQVPDTAPGPASCYLGTGTGYDYALNELSLIDSTGGWFSGQPTDCVGLVVKEYTSTQVVLQFGSYYHTNGWVLHSNDAVTIRVADVSISRKVSY